MAAVLKHGGMWTFNASDGFCEALVKGFRSGFLRDEDYHHMTRCESVEGTRRCDESGRTTP